MRTVRVDDARAAFEAHAVATGAPIGDLTAEEAVGLVLGWYRTERADDVELDDGGDMLLYQWGTYDWGDGPSFEFDITRQLIGVAHAVDDDIWQLSVTLYFPPSAETRAVGQGDRWCEHPDDLEELRLYIFESAAMTIVRGRRADRVRVRYEATG